MRGVSSVFGKRGSVGASGSLRGYSGLLLLARRAHGLHPVHPPMFISINGAVAAKLPEDLERIGHAPSPLVVTDAGVRAAGVLQTRRVAALGDPPIRVDATPSNPNEAAVRAAGSTRPRVRRADRRRRWPARPGQGSRHRGHPRRSAEDLRDRRGRQHTRISDRVAPVVAVPTTAGTGSEVARGAIVIVDDGRKLGFHSWHLVPRPAICDPELTLGLPPKLTAATGMDAIAHCMETFMAPAVTRRPTASRWTAWSAAGRASSAPRATAGTARPAGHDGREHQGALAFQKGLGCVHSLSHSLGGVEPATASRHAERGVPAGGGALQRERPNRVKERACAQAHAMGLPVRRARQQWPMRSAR